MIDFYLFRLGRDESPLPYTHTVSAQTVYGSVSGVEKMLIILLSYLRLFDRSNVRSANTTTNKREDQHTQYAATEEFAAVSLKH